MMSCVSAKLNGDQALVPSCKDLQNGSILNGHYIPDELLYILLCKVDRKSLLNCQLVCRKWSSTIRTYVWRKKAEIQFGYSLQSLKHFPWSTFYTLSMKQHCFERNLLRNTSGELGVGYDKWCMSLAMRPWWKVETASVPPYTNFHAERAVITYQVINLIDEGLTTSLLDELQPPILVEDWYFAEVPCIYMNIITLFGQGLKEIRHNQRFDDSCTDSRTERWFKYSTKIENYGPGVRRIEFRRVVLVEKWREYGHLGCKMAKGSVCVSLKALCQ